VEAVVEVGDLMQEAGFWLGSRLRKIGLIFAWHPGHWKV
jgi:hypothetical protein